jgi:hypothetical protein
MIIRVSQAAFMNTFLPSLVCSWEETIYPSDVHQKTNNAALMSIYFKRKVCIYCCTQLYFLFMYSMASRDRTVITPWASRWKGFLADSKFQVCREEIMTSTQTAGQNGTRWCKRRNSDHSCSTAGRISFQCFTVHAYSPTLGNSLLNFTLVLDPATF